jgi:hypothetical protein
MSSYYVNQNAQLGGDHEVHVYGCSFMPAVENRFYLGEFVSCQPAVTEAKRYYWQSNGCFFCCNSCHTS